MMTPAFRQLLFASTLGVAVGAFAAQPASPTPSPATTKTDQTQADRDFEAAKAACQTERSKTARSECLRRAEDTYNKATNATGTTPLSGAGGTGAGAQQGRARS